MARTFDQIYASLGSAYDPSVQLVQQQVDAIPGATDASIAQATAKKDQAFEQITEGARRRGMGFSGIPLDEQAVYASTEFAPAVANIRNQGENRKVSLLEALNGYTRERTTQAQGILDNELARDFQEKQFNESVRQFNEQQEMAKRQAAAAASAGGSGSAGDYLGLLGGGGNAGSAGGAKMSQKSSGKGFAFTDAKGRPMSAASYAKTKGIPFRSLLQQMANSGDYGAAVALQVVGNDFGVDRGKVGKGFSTKQKSYAPNSKEVWNYVNALMW